MQPTHKGHNDRREPVTHWHMLREPANRPSHFQRPGQTGQCTRQAQRRPERAARRKPGVASCGRSQAANLLGKTSTRTEDEQCHQRHHHQAEHQTDVDPIAVKESRHASVGWERLGGRHAEAKGIAPGAKHKIIQQLE